MSEGTSARDMSDNGVMPFSCGSQYEDWKLSNCERCKKFDPKKSDKEKCEIDYEIGLAYFGNGHVPEEIAKRMGYLDNQDAYVWPCGEVEWTEEWKKEREKMLNDQQ